MLRPPVCRRKCPRRLPCAAARFSSLKHAFIRPSGAGSSAGFVRLIRRLHRGAQRSKRVSDCYCDTFLKQKMSFPALRAAVAAVCRAQSAVEYRVARCLRYWTHRRAAETK